LITSRGSTGVESNVFDNEFTTDPVDVDWNDWMRWEGGLEAPVQERKNSSGSTVVSSPRNWYSDLESTGNDAVSASSIAGNEFSFENASFELDDGAQLARGPQLGPENGAFPTVFEVPQKRSYRGYPSLTQAEEQTLQNIAMPYLLSKVKLSSEPSTPTDWHSLNSPSPSPSPEPESRPRKNKKRKSIIENDDIPTTLSQSRKRGHNAIEKRYRTNLNDKINCLRQGIPSLSETPSSDSKFGNDGEDSDAEGVDSKTGQQKYGKAAILTRALEYIQHLEITTQRLGGEVTTLKTRVGAFEKLAMSGSIVMNANAGSRMSELAKSETLQSIQAGEFLNYIINQFSAFNICRF
jgi:hypothetical protein